MAHFLSGSVSSPRVLKPEEKPDELKAPEDRVDPLKSEEKSDELKAPEDKVDALKSESEAPEVKLDEPRDP